MEPNVLFIEAITIPPKLWTKRHIEILPKRYLLDKVSSYTLHEIWSDLPTDLKNDPELQSHLPCLEHYNRDVDEIHIDGPPPPKYRCRICRAHKNRRHQATTPESPRSLV